MTGKAWMALVSLMVVAFVLAGCAGGKQNAGNRNQGPSASSQMTCDRYQQMTNAGYEFRFENGLWVAYSSTGDRYVLTADEVRAGYLNDPCWNQDSNSNGNNWQQPQRHHRINNRDSKYQRWLKDHS